MQPVRAIFISDVHLGTRACQAESLLAFLREHESEYLYLLGDIIDFWAMNRSVQWAGAHNTVVQKVLRRARHGCKVFFIPGNHDEALREYAGVAFGDIRVESEWIHETLDGRRYPAFLTDRRRIAAGNMRKLFCENDLTILRRNPRCRHSVPDEVQVRSVLRAARWRLISTEGRSARMRARCCCARSIARCD